MRTQKRNQGFTLVEVIVVAVIVAVLALVGIQLYTGYVQDARINTAENLAASAAGYLTTERNRGATGTIAMNATTRVLEFGTAATGTATSFTVPANAALTLVAATATSDGTVKAQIGTNAADTSKTYKW